MPAAPACLTCESLKRVFWAVPPPSFFQRFHGGKIAKKVLEYATLSTPLSSVPVINQKKG